MAREGGDCIRLRRGQRGFFRRSIFSAINSAVRAIIILRRAGLSFAMMSLCLCALDRIRMMRFSERATTAMVRSVARMARSIAAITRLARRSRCRSGIPQCYHSNSPESIRAARSELCTRRSRLPHTDRMYPLGCRRLGSNWQKRRTVVQVERPWLVLIEIFPRRGRSALARWRVAFLRRALRGCG